MFGRNKFDSGQVLSSMKAKHQRYEALVKAFHADIYRYAYWLIKDQSIAEDVVQETFLRAWRSLDALNDEKALQRQLDKDKSNFSKVGKMAMKRSNKPPLK